MILFTKQNKGTDVENKCMDVKGEWVELGNLGLTYIHDGTMYKNR